jgi:hypothetical protein
MEGATSMKDKWSHDELNELQQAWENGIGWLDISKALGRTPDSCRMKYRQTFGETGKSGKMKDPKYISASTPRVGLLDLETLPLEGYAWQMWDVSFGIEQVISGTGLLSWAGKIMNEKTVYSDILTPKEAKAKDDKRITQSLWEFLQSCQVVIGHNLIDFDSKVAATFFLKHGLPPLKYVQIDTLKIARQHFKFDSNKMGFLNRQLGIKEKIANEGFPLWRACREGDADALNRMNEYNIGDIQALEDLYYILRPYIKHMNVALYSEALTMVCPVCGSTDLHSDGFYYTPAGKYESMRCGACMCVSRKKDNLLDKHKRKSLLVNS